MPTFLEILTDADEVKIICIVIGVVLSAIVSFLLSLRKERHEIRKYRYELQKIYANQLQQKRIEVYPAFYYEISAILKKAYDTEASAGKIQALMQELPGVYARLIEMDSKYSLFFSGNTSNLFFELRISLKELMGKYKEKKELNGEAFKQDAVSLFQQAERFEIALKRDLGIFAVEFRPDESPKNYNDIDYIQKRIHPK